MRFVLVNQLVALEPGGSVDATVTFPADAWFFADHFPGFPVVPGTMLTEAMAQTAGWLLLATLEFQRWPLLTSVERATFRRPVRSEESLQLHASVRSAHPADFEVDAQAAVLGRRVADARLLFHAFDAAGLDGDGYRLLRWARSVFTGLGGDALLGGTSSGRPHV
jgi:3-hydroxyacyl-[acyl-carrier-protein] dehydratase